MALSCAQHRAGRWDWLKSDEKHRQADRQWSKRTISRNFTTRGKIPRILEKKPNPKGENKSRVTVLKHPYNSESSWRKNIKKIFFHENTLSTFLDIKACENQANSRETILFVVCWLWLGAGGLLNAEGKHGLAPALSRHRSYLWNTLLRNTPHWCLASCWKETRQTPRDSAFSPPVTSLPVP